MRQRTKTKYFFETFRKRCTNLLRSYSERILDKLPPKYDRPLLIDLGKKITFSCNYGKVIDILITFIMMIFKTPNNLTILSELMLMLSCVYPCVTPVSFKRSFFFLRQ